MAVSTKILDEPSYILHRYDWSESSLVIDVFTRHYGRVAVVAKGAKKPNSSFRPVLLPLQRLLLNFAGDSEVKTLKSAQWAGASPMPAGAALLSGFYINELLRAFIAKEDANPLLFDVYALVVGLIASQGKENSEMALRAFELILLRQIGLLPSLQINSETQVLVQANTHYQLFAGQGLIPTSANEQTLSGQQCLDLATLLEHFQIQNFDDLLLCCGQALLPLKLQLRALLHYHGACQSFKTRELMRQVQALNQPVNTQREAPPNA
jgi:DNA repair protein RecO (recombination protein O)